MAQTNPVKPTPTQVTEAQKMWDGFVHISKYAIIVTCLILAGLAAAFVPW